MDPFWEGFEHQKEAKLKELALASMMLTSPMKAKANDMWGTIGRAAKAQFSQPKVIQKVQQATQKGVAVGGAKASVKDFSKLRLEKGKFNAEVAPSQLTAQYKLSPDLDLTGELVGGEKRIGLNFRKDF